MLESFDIIRNVGRYETVSNTPSFGQLTLVYSENGRGKTTLCAVLRSLASGDVDTLLERRRLSATHPPTVVANLDGSKIAFAPSGWNAQYPKPVVVFDEKFVNDNVFSGLTVAAGQRKNLHELVLGEQGVTFQQKVVQLTDEISQLQSTLKEKERNLTKDIVGRLSVDEFCDLQKVDSVDAAIATAQAAVSVLESSSAVAATKDFESVDFPRLDNVATGEVLETSLAEVHEESVKAVNDHFKALGKGAENWISNGKKFTSITSDDGCPFCGEDLGNSELFKHYEAYFSDAYEQHIAAIQAHHAEWQKAFGGDSLADFIGRLGELKARHEFWNVHLELPDFKLDSAKIEDAWKRYRKSVTDLLQTKLANPLSKVQVSESVQAEFVKLTDLRNEVKQVCDELVGKSDEIKRLKEQAKHGSLSTAQSELERLQTIQRRFEPANIKLCLEYVKAKADKLAAEALKITAKTNLNTYRDTSFPKCQTDVNKFLLRFNADFSLESFKPVDPQGQPSSSYALTVNQKSVPISTSNADPCFGTTLSTGDRNTLALAFFFASLEANPNLSDAIVIIDDPASSLDDGRTVATAQEIRKLVGITNQVIVLSHSKRLLCEIWGNGNHGSCESMKIVDAGPDSSSIESWDVSDASISDYDRRHECIRKYVESSEGQAKDVAVSLRPALEGYLRIACVEHFPPGTLLGGFTGHAKNMEDNGNPIIASAELVELDELREYTNRFHHENPLWQAELANLNETELRGFARRVLEFTRAIRRTV